MNCNVLKGLFIYIKLNEVVYFAAAAAPPDRELLRVVRPHPLPLDVRRPHVCPVNQIVFICHHIRLILVN